MANMYFEKGKAKMPQLGGGPQIKKIIF